MGSSSPIPTIWKMVAVIAAAASIVQVGGAQSRQSAAPSTGVFIETDPLEATVFIDGTHAGLTPLRREDVAAGTHRVRIVKSGYLENSRMITVSSREAAHLDIRLTPARTPSAQAQTGTASGGGDSILNNKWVWIGAAGGGATVAALALTRNSAPSPGQIVVSPTATGMAGQTIFTLQASATDPDKDALTFAWNFGDGGTGSGQSVTHTYASAGTFQAQVSVSDGKHTVTAPSASVTVGPNLTGTWTGGTIMMPDPTGNITVTCGLALALTQSGSSVTGTMGFTGACTGGPGSLASGSANPLTHPSAVSVTSGTFAFPGGPLSQSLVISFVGTTSSTGTTLSGNVTLASPSIGFVRTTATSFTKQ